MYHQPNASISINSSPRVINTWERKLINIRHCSNVKHSEYDNSVTSNPESAPKIDWAYYKSRITVPGLVDTFQKNYDSVKVPYPPDNLTSQVVTQEGQVKSEIDNFKSSSNARISEHQKAIEHLKALLPYEQMTMEDYRDAFPEVWWFGIEFGKFYDFFSIHRKLWIQSIIQHSGHTNPKTNWVTMMARLDMVRINFGFISEGKRERFLVIV